MKYLDWGHAGKAIVAGIVSLIGALLLVVTGNESLADVTVAEWLLVAGTVLGSYGLTYAAPANQSGKHEAVNR